MKCLRSDAQASVQTCVLPLGAVGRCHGWYPRRILDSACAPGAVGLPRQGAASPYARLAVNAPHLVQKMMGTSATVRARACPWAAMASSRTEGFGPGQRCAVNEAFSCCSRVSLRQTLHLHSPPAYAQSCPSAVRCLAPSAATGGLTSLSLGRGGKVCVTLAIVLTTSLARLSAASSSAAAIGVGCGCSETAAFASVSAHWLPIASCLKGSSFTVSGFTWAFTFLTVT